MERPDLPAWKTRSRKTILEHGKFLTVEEHEIELPDGTVIPDWAWVIAPNAALVLAETIDKKFLCFHQTKYAVDGTTLAPIGGHVEPNEDPLDAAKRELLEETGYQASHWINLGEFAVGANRGFGKRYLFFARQADKVEEPQNDDLEEQILLQLELSELETAMRNGEFKVASWAALVALALHRIHED